MNIYVYVTAVTRVPMKPLTLTRVPLGTLTRVPLGLVTLHPDYSPMLFQRLPHYQKVQNLLLV